MERGDFQLVAIYHFTTKPIKRSDGRSAVAAAAYRAGELLVDHRTGLVHDYAHRKEEARIESWIQAPEKVGGWVHEREGLWNAAEFAEKRKNSRPAREVEVALPVELSEGRQNELLRSFVAEQLVSHGVAADVCVHRGDPENPHAHIMLTTREVGPGEVGLGKKVRELDRTPTTERWRKLWAEHTNERLKETGSPERIDHRSLKAQGINREPTVHEGPQVRAIQRKNLPPPGEWRGGPGRDEVRRHPEEREHRREDRVRDPVREREDDRDREVDRDLF